jgi:PTH1 family peptidyl-tRNA hydrolase
VAKIGPVLLVKPMTFMNLSGQPLVAVADFYKIKPEEMLLVVDDMALPLGRLRLRLEGGTGGHNGLESVICELATEKIARLRVGIGTPPPDTAVDHVLGRFFDEEKPVIEAAIGRAAEAAKWAIDNGLLSAMNTFNKAEEI